MIDFDQEIYRTESVNCEPVCDKELFDCTPCDYTLPFEDCIYQTSSRNNTCQDSIYNVCTLDSSRQFCTEQRDKLEESEKNSNEKLTLLDNKNKFGVLHEFNTKVEFDSTQTEFYDPFVLWFHNPNPCSAVVIYVDTYLGDPLVSVNTLIWGKKYAYNNYGYWGPEVLSLCTPDSYGSFEIYLSLFTPCKGTVWVESFDIPSETLNSYSGKYEEMIKYVFSVNALYTISNIPQNKYRDFPLQVTPGCHDYYVKFLDVEETYYASIYCGNNTNRVLGGTGFAYIDKHYYACSSDVFYPNYEDDIENNNYDRKYVWFEIEYWEEVPEEVSFYFFSSERFPNLFPLRKTTEYSVFQSAYTLMGDSFLKCDSKSYFCGYNREAVCEQFAPLPASSITSLFWPIPTIALTQSSKFDGLWTNEELWTPSFFTSSEYRLNNSLHYSFLLSADQDQQNLIYHSESVLDTCQLILFRPPKNENGEPFQRKRAVTFKKRETNCKYHDFINFYDKSKELFEKMDSARGQYQTNYRFEVDIFMMSFEFQDCLEYHDNVLSTEKYVWVNESSKTCISKQSSDEFNEDPCCNLKIQWKENCHPTNKSIQKTMMYVNETYVKSNCETAQCVSDLSLPSYHELRTLQQDPINGCSSVLPDSFSFFREGFQPVSECLREHITFRKKCSKDSDCETLGGRCDFTSFQCLVESQQREMNYLQCVWEKLDTFVREEVMSQKSLGTDPTIEELYETFSKTDCVGKYEIDAKGRKINFLDSLQSEDECFSSNIIDYMDYRSVDESSWLPFDLDYHQYCYRKWEIEESSEKLCISNNTFCNWNKSIQCSSLDNQTCTELCTKGNDGSEYFCGICENGEDCIELSSIKNEKECEEKEICVHGNNIYDGHCESIWGCDRKCFDHITREFYECKVEEQCLTEGGRCVVDDKGPEEDYSNWDHYLFSPDILEKYYYWHNIYSLDVIRAYFSMGVCFHEEFYPSFSKCDWVNPISNNLQRLTMFGCLSYERNQTYCENVLNGTWVNLIASSKEQCSSLYGKSCRENYTTYNFARNFFTSEQINSKNESECSESGGKWSDTMVWMEGHWIQSQSRKPKWMKREYKNRNSMSKTLDFMSLRNSIRDALDSQIGYTSKTEAYCLYGRVLPVIELHLCDCLEKEHKDRYENENEKESGNSICFNQYSLSQYVGVTVACPGLQNKAIFPPQSLLFQEHSLSSGDRCHEIKLFSEGSALLKEPSSNLKLSATILAFRQDTSTYDYGFKNSYSTFVGQVIGTGSQIRSTVEHEYDEEKGKVRQSFKNVTLCLTLSSLYFEKKFDIPDFAILVDLEESRLDPQNVQVDLYINGEDGNEIKINNENIRDYNNVSITFCSVFPSLQTNVTYYPVMRMDDWEDEDYLELSSSDIVFGYLLAFLYLGVTIIASTLYSLYFKVPNERRASLKVRSLLLIISIFGFMRSLYFFLLVDGTLDDSDQIVHYFLVDCITILFFTTFLSYLLLVWIPMIAYIFRSKGFHYDSIPFIKILILINVFVYSFVIAMMIAYEVSKETSNVYVCGVQVGTETDTSKQETVTTIYRIFWSLYAFLVSASFMVVAIKLYDSLSHSSLKTSNQGVKSKEDKMKSLLLRVMGIITISFFLQSIAFLSLEFIDVNSLASVFIFLVLVEILPCIVVVYMLRPKLKAKGRARSSTTALPSSNNNNSSGLESPRSNIFTNSNSYGGDIL